MVVDSINRTDMDLRKSLFGNIVLSGGSTLTKGFGDRLLNEVQRLAVKDMRIKIFAPPERKYSTWIGGSILAGLSTFRKVIFTKECCALLEKADLFFYLRCGSILMIGTRILISYIRSLIRYPNLLEASDRDVQCNLSKLNLIHLHTSSSVARRNSQDRSFQIY